MSIVSKSRILVLGAGFGGLEVATLLSEALGESAEVTLIDKSDAFVFGFSKLDVMFGYREPEAVRLPYSNFAKPGIRLLKRTITAIDPVNRQVTTNDGVFEADFLVVALGAEYDFNATPGLAATTEFYSVAGAEQLRDVLPTFTTGKALIGVCGAPFKCPPAPSECALMLHDYLVNRGVRDGCEIALVMPLASPVPPSPQTSHALLAAFGQRNIDFIAGRHVAAVDNARNVAVLDDGREMPFDLFLGVPKHRVPQVVLESGMSENGWIPVNPRTLETSYENVYALGDGANTGTPKAGVFAEKAARAVASALVAKVRRNEDVVQYDGIGTCYIEFGGGRIGKVEVDFFSGPTPTGNYHEPSVALRADKENFGSSRRARWFNL
ncbi:FAD/NAD(P)-binding oxidoreductase [Pelagibacterium sp. H642]|uniref:NAD(P)/FAD-dependent oxidoreductase n=1 Tax=Pelagibacterium sp. H642 TaxID=1881069 RepID=UPI002815D28F|nr:FAD/NAD(P)-binding oxidoreductase [Pelagibacterium sp. H642]WMT92586.1 NAD(P)/FAD-dependent oxidoreductase [Pelagibacterium sp. H642]